MREQTENESPEKATARDPYGDVALGVECAWPGAFPTCTRRTRRHEEKGSADVVLQAGESYRLARPGLAVVEAFQDASISID